MIFDFVTFYLTSVAVTFFTAWFLRSYTLRRRDTVFMKFQLKRSQESLEFALQSGRMGTWDINLETDEVTCSKEMLDLWGIVPSNFNGERSLLQSKVHPDDLQKMKEAINLAIKTESIYESEYRITPYPGKLQWVMSRGRCTYAANSKRPIRLAGVIFDITDKKEKEQILNSAIKARDQFFMMAGHELRTPLTCLQLQLQVGQWDLQHNYQEAFSKEKIESGLKKQQEHLLRITRIVDNILDETKISEGRFTMQYEKFDLCDMVRDVLDRFLVIARSSAIEVEFRPLHHIEGFWDRYRLEQVLHNLLTNAIRYGNKRPICVEVTRENDDAILTVRDQGTGIKREDQERVFERFERAVSEDEPSGMGLGLYISNSIVKAHGGEIRLKSELGKGSEFSVVLPSFRPL